MSGEKHACAAQAAVALYDLFARALRVPCEILGFTTARAPLYWIFKSFQERRIDRHVLGARILSREVCNNMASNPDGDAILFAWERIRTQKQTRKVIVVLSDGSPSESASRDPAATLEAAIRAVRAQRGGEIYGIGIQDTNVRRFYSPNAPVINHPSEVTGALIHTLQDVLQRKPGGGL
jgi:cobalamin biosynthesis protein CobT